MKEAGTYKEGISLAAKAWRALSATDKKPYAEEAAKRKLQYEKELKAFLEAGGEKKKTKQILDVTPTKRRKKETTAAKGDDTTPSRKRKYHVNARKDDEPTPSKERKKDANAPKRPAGGAYGCHLEENRQRFMQQCKGQSATAVSKMDNICGNTPDSLFPAGEMDMEGTSSHVMVKSIDDPWCNDIAAGRKFFECVANRKRFTNQFKTLKAGDLFVVVRKKNLGRRSPLSL